MPETVLVEVTIGADVWAAENAYAITSAWLADFCRVFKHYQYSDVRRRAKMATQSTFERQYAKQRANKRRRDRRRG